MVALTIQPCSLVTLILLCLKSISRSVAQTSNTCPPTEYGPNAGVIQSPGFSQHLNYGNDVQCTYNIRVADGGRVLFNVSSFATEQCCDKLTIYNGPSINSPVIISWSGIVPAGSYVESASNAVTAVFRSDNSINAAGFSVQYLPTHIQYSTTTSAPNTLNVIDWTNRTDNYNKRYQNISILVLHDTVTGGAEETLELLNKEGLSVHYIAGKNGTIYRMVNDSWRAWHAGVSDWGPLHNLNNYSVGIEIVNWGNEPFPDVQVKAVAAISRIICDTWKILPKNIVSHGDIIPSNKEDPSGWFNYKLFYAEMGLFPGLYITSLTVADQTKVLYQNSTTYNPAVLRLQQQLHTYGYALTIDGIYGRATENVAEAFNRHFCPEIFIKELIVPPHGGNLIRNPKNQRWYGISQERLNYLLAHT